MDNRSSKKQQELLLFIDGFIKGNGYGPSYREIMRALGYKSVSTVAVHIEGLITKGYIRKRDNSARSIEIITLRNDLLKQAPKEAGTSSEGVEWLEREIEQRLKSDGGNSKEIQVLIDAAIILGSQKVDELKAKVGLQQDNDGTVG